MLAGCKAPSKAFSVVYVYILWNEKYSKHPWIIHELLFLRLILVLCVLKNKIKHLHTIVKNTFFKTEQCLFFRVAKNPAKNSIISNIYYEKEKKHLLCK